MGISTPLFNTTFCIIFLLIVFYSGITSFKHFIAFKVLGYPT